MDGPRWIFGPFTLVIQKAFSDIGPKSGPKLLVEKISKSSCAWTGYDRKYARKKEICNTLVSMKNTE